MHKASLKELQARKNKLKSNGKENEKIIKKLDRYIRKAQ